MNLSNVLKTAAGLVAIGFCVYAINDRIKSRKAVVEKKELVKEITNLSGEITAEAKENGYVFTEEDNTEIEAFMKLTHNDDIISLHSAINILQTKLERISGKSAEVREVERKEVGADVMELISLIYIATKDKNVKLTEEQTFLMECAVSAVQRDANKLALKMFRSKLEELKQSI